MMASLSSELSQYYPFLINDIPMNRGSLCQLDTNGSTTSIDGSNYAELLPVEEINKT